MSEIKKYRKKPVEIEAVQYTEYGKLVKGMCNSRSCYASGNTNPHVHTIHNNQIVNLEVGDYIIPEPDGKHFYPCKPDIFKATYEGIHKNQCTQEGTVMNQLIPTDKETEEWFIENIADGCSASSGIYKYKLWLLERRDAILKKNS